MKCTCSRPSGLLAAHCATFVALLAANPAQAQQFVLLDATYTATSANTEDSQYTAAPAKGIPSDLRAPVDYASGSVHVDLEVLEKPSTAKTLYNICFENSTDYACLPYVMYSDKGTYTADPKFSDLWQYDAVDWSQGVSKVLLVLKNQNQQKVHGDADFYPYKVHVTLTVVAPGATFDPKQTNTMGPAAGGGGMSGSDGAADTGGSGGKGGSTDKSAGGSGGMSADAGRGGSDDAASTDSDADTGSDAETDTNMDMDMESEGGAGMTAPPSSSNSANAQNQASSSSDQTKDATTARSTLNAGSGASSDAESRTISSQLENTSGCSVATVGADRTTFAWSLLGMSLCVLGLRRRR